MPGNHQHRNVIAVGAGNTGDEVGGTGAGSGTADADLARFARVAVGHEGGSGFVPRQNVAYAASAGTSGKRIVEWFDRAAGNAEHVLDPHLFQIGDQQIGHFNCLSRNNSSTFTSRGCTAGDKRDC